MANDPTEPTPRERTAFEEMKAASSTSRTGMSDLNLSASEVAAVAGGAPDAEAPETPSTPEPEPPPSQEPGPSPEPASPGEGTSPEPETPATEPDGDYDEEAHAEYPAPEAEPPKDTAPEPPKQTQSDDADKVWNQYPDEAARKKALVENKRYAAKLAEENRALKAKLEPGATAPPAEVDPTAPIPQPTLADRKAKFEELRKTDPKLDEAASILERQREAIGNQETALHTQETGLAQIDNELVEIDIALKRISKRLEADPENYTLTQERDALVSERTGKRHERLEAKDRVADARDVLARNTATYKGNAEKIRGFIDTTIVGEREKAQLSAISTREMARTEREWPEHFKVLADELKIPTANRPAVNRYLMGLAIAKGLPEDIKGWILGQKDEVRQVFGTIVGGKPATETVAASRRRDANIQSAPATESEARAETRKEKVLDPRDVAAESRRGLAAELSRTIRPSA